jgi:hypothetical protein
MISPLLERRQVLRAKQNPRPSQGERASIVQGGNPASRFRSPSSRPAQPSAVASAKFQGWKPSSIHIELGDSEHGPMAERLVEDLCGDDPRPDGDRPRKRQYAPWSRGGISGTPST